MKKKLEKNLPAQVPNSSVAQQLIEMCSEILPALGDEKIRIDLSKHGGEITQKSNRGVQRLHVAPGYQEVSQGNIKGLPPHKQRTTVKELRKQGLTQAQVANRLNVSQSYISQIENRD